MKFSFLFLFAAFSTTLFAQSPLNEQAQKLERSKMSVDLLDEATRELGFTAEEIAHFNELYNEYTVAKEEIDAERRTRLNEFVMEMKENDGARDERKETADFIEDYLDFQEDESDVQRKYFSKFEKEIDPLKVLRFFSMEERYLADIYRDRLTDVAPKLLILEPAVRFGR